MLMKNGDILMTIFPDLSEAFERLNKVKFFED